MGGYGGGGWNQQPWGGMDTQMGMYQQPQQNQQELQNMLGSMGSAYGSAAQNQQQGPGQGWQQPPGWGSTMYPSQGGGRGQEGGGYGGGLGGLLMGPTGNQDVGGYLGGNNPFMDAMAQFGGWGNQSPISYLGDEAGGSYGGGWNDPNNKWAGWQQPAGQTDIWSQYAQDNNLGMPMIGFGPGADRDAWFRDHYGLTQNPGQNQLQTKPGGMPSSQGPGLASVATTISNMQPGRGQEGGAAGGPGGFPGTTTPAQTSAFDTYQANNLAGAG